VHKETLALVEHYKESSPATRSAGALWYPQAYEHASCIATRQRTPIERVVYVIAALSPLQGWTRNLEIAEDAIRNHKRGVQAPWSFTFGQLEHKAVHILDGNLEALSGPKVTAFARAILGDITATVIDGWMLKALKWDRDYASPGRRHYERLAFALTAAAHLCDVAVTTFQATVWLAVRGETWR
jgi:hypothetical protein